MEDLLMEWGREGATHRNTGVEQRRAVDLKLEIVFFLGMALSSVILMADFRFMEYVLTDKWDFRLQVPFVMDLLLTWSSLTVVPNGNRCKTWDVISRISESGFVI